jgi:ABC-type bacteriocin/lantibiotic exporter with double-glycine peptidase domain
MNVPDGQVIAAIVAMGGAIYGIGRPLINAYIRNMDEQTKANIQSIELRDKLLSEHVTNTSTTLVTLLEEHRTHDTLSCAAHVQQTKAIESITQLLSDIHKRDIESKGGEQNVSAD